MLMLQIRYTEQKAYNSQQAGVTTAIVMAILVPVAIASACLVFWIIGFVRKRSEIMFGFLYS